MQNDTIHPDGAYAATGAAAHATEQNVVANTLAVLEAARASRVPVLYSRILVYPVPGLSGDNAPIFRMLAPDTFKAGSWGAAVVVVGAWTNMAVEHTVRDAADHGYEVTVVADATSSLSPQWQDAALSYALTNIAATTDTASITATLRG